MNSKWEISAKKKISNHKSGDFRSRREISSKKEFRLTKIRSKKYFSTKRKISCQKRRFQKKVRSTKEDFRSKRGISDKKTNNSKKEIRNSKTSLHSPFEDVMKPSVIVSPFP